MQAPARPSRARASGGRTLILLGVLLAIAAGAIVIFVMSTNGANPLASTVQVVVANQDLPAGEVLSTSKSGPDPVANVTYIPISQAFITKTVNADFAPKDAYVFQSQSSLNSQLNNEVIQNTFYSGEILRNNDPRLAAAGVGAPGSLTANNPGKLKDGEVLAQIPLSTKPAVVPGDFVNVLATFCNIPGKSGCETQTTLTNVYIYAISGNNVFVVVTNQQAVNLQYLTGAASSYELVIRKPGDTTTPNTTPANDSSTAGNFNY